MTHEVVLITGGTRGLGEAIARRAIASGWHAALVFRSGQERADSLAEELGEAGGSVSLHRADLARVAECERVVAEISDDIGPPLRLVNNAGVLHQARVGQVTEADWDAVHDVNLRSAYFLAQACWPAMREARFGRVVNVGSVTAMSGNPGQAAYGASKAGLVGVTRSLAMAGARRGITVNCVVPGIFATDMALGMDAADQERLWSLIPVGRTGDPDELAVVVAMLLDRHASYITGAVVPVDGGLGVGQ